MSRTGPAAAPKRNRDCPADAGSSPPPSPPRSRWRRGRKHSSSSGSRSPARRSSAPTPKGQCRSRSSPAKGDRQEPAPPAINELVPAQFRRSTSSTRASSPAIRRRARARAPAPPCAASARTQPAGAAQRPSAAGQRALRLVGRGRGDSMSNDSDLGDRADRDLKDGGRRSMAPTPWSGVFKSSPASTTKASRPPLLRQEEPQRRRPKSAPT